jgi:SAM-dependent methyltransferase
MGRLRCGSFGRTPPDMDEDGYFYEQVAASYDDWESDMFAPAVIEATVDVLAGLAGSGRALELAIGTGRVALPLAARGVQVAGIELSPHMAEHDHEPDDARGPGRVLRQRSGAP